MLALGAIWQLVRRLASFAVLAVAVFGVYPATGLAWEVDAKRFADVVDGARRVVVPSAEAITEIERASVEIAGRVDRLRSAQKIYAAQRVRRQWIEGMDRQLAHAVEAAERERRIQEQIGTWAMFFQIVSDVYTVVETAVETDAGTPEAPRGEEAGAEGEMQLSDDRHPASPDQHEDGLQGSGEEHNGIVVVCDAGKCEAFRAGDLVDAALNPLSSFDSSQISELEEKIRDTTNELPPLGCWLDDETCSPFSGPAEQISNSIDQMVGRTSVEQAPAGGVLQSGQGVTEASVATVARVGLVAGKGVVKLLKKALKPLKNKRGGRIPRPPHDGKKTVGEILDEFAKHGKKKTGNYKQYNLTDSKLPPGSPSWGEFRGMPWGEITKGAKVRKPGYQQVKKLLDSLP